MKKDIVKKGYEKIANEYASKRDQFESIPYLKKLANQLGQGSSVLDIGCGAGLPVDRLLADRGYRVTGIDISQAMIELAKKMYPKRLMK